MVKAIGLLSGGLDSMLAVKVLQEQGIDVLGLSFTTPFFGADRATAAAAVLGIELRVMDITEDHLRIADLSSCIPSIHVPILSPGHGAAVSFRFPERQSGQKPGSDLRIHGAGSVSRDKWTLWSIGIQAGRSG